MTFRDDRPLCPSCDSALAPVGARYVCEQCGGMLVSAAEVDDMLNTMFPGDVTSLDQRLHPAGWGTPRACPWCVTPMAMLVLEGIPVDRCHQHGLWFDANELRRVLDAQGHQYVMTTPDPKRSGWFDVTRGKLTAWELLKMLLGR